MKIPMLAVVVVASLVTGAHAEEAHSLTGNISVVSDYRFRGISQTFRDPAIQGGFDYTHSSGLYMGNWNSSISSALFPSTSGVEIDVYGGYKFSPVQDLTADLGFIYYYYPGARYIAGTNRESKFNNGEIYFGASYKWLSAKYFVTVTEYFGLHAPGQDDSKGSGYLDLNASVEVAPKTTMSLHAGRQMVKNYGRLNYNDYRVGLTYDLGFGVVGLAVIGTDADSTLYTLSNGTKSRNLGETSTILSFTKAF